MGADDREWMEIVILGLVAAYLVPVVIRAGVALWADLRGK